MFTAAAGNIVNGQTIEKSFKQFLSKGDNFQGFKITSKPQTGIKFLPAEVQLWHSLLIWRMPSFLARRRKSLAFLPAEVQLRHSLLIGECLVF